MTRLAAFSCIAVFLAGCATDGVPPPAIVTQPVNVAVGVPCAPKIATAPVYPDSDTALRSAQNLFERVKLLLAGRAMRQARLAVLEPALAACAKGGGDGGNK